jgi:hypothetical protein
LVYEHSQPAPDGGTVLLGSQEKRRPHRVIDQVNDKLTWSEPGRVDTRDDGADRI